MGPSDDAQPDVETDASVPEASDVASAALAHQRAEHADNSIDVDETGVGALVNNTGLDGDAASG